MSEEYRMGKRLTYPTCKHDGFPLVTIDGHLQCVAEYLDRCIGQKRVVDMVQRDEAAYYVFEDGHELPLLCFCCGEALTVFDLDKSRQNIHGRRLKAMAMGSVELTDGRELPQFRLVFSTKGLFSSELIEPLSPEVAVQMRHPDDCLHKPRLSPTVKRRKKKR
jgi:hypothetical protein